MSNKEEILIEYYKIDFYQKTGKILRTSFETKVEIKEILHAINEFIPSTYQIKTIVKQGSSEYLKEESQKITGLRYIFSGILNELGYKLPEIANALNMKRTSVYHHLRTIANALRIKTGYEDIVKTYDEIYKIAFNDERDI